MDELVRLAERCEQATGPVRVLDFDISRSVQMPLARNPQFTASIDAAMTLVPEGVGFAFERLEATCAAWVGEAPVAQSRIAATPALALCAAALRARASLKEQTNA